MLVGLNPPPLFETLIKGWNTQEELTRSSYQPGIEAAFKYAEDKPGIIAIRQVGDKEVIWKREDIPSVVYDDDEREYAEAWLN